MEVSANIMSLDSSFIVISRVLFYSLKKMFVEITILIRQKHSGGTFLNACCALLVLV